MSRSGCGVNELTGRGPLAPGTPEYGAAFEHFIVMELRAHANYMPRDNSLPVSYRRTASGIEVDFILGNAEVAVGAKSTDRPTGDHLKGLRAWRDEHPKSRCIPVCRAARPAYRRRDRNPAVGRLPPQPLAGR